MIDIRWVDTRSMYYDIINAPDDATREALYQRHFLQPWQQMMTMVAGGFGGQQSDDPYAGAKAWHWLIPEQLRSAPPSLLKLEAAGAWEMGQEAMAKAAERFAPYSERIPLDYIEGWLVLADPQTADPIGRGYTGGIDFMQPRFIAQYSDPNDYNLPRLGGCIVHEMHHLIRLRLFPWNMMTTTVADYILYEGLAESFAAAIFGEEVVGYYVSEFDEREIATARRLIGDNLDTTGFDKLRAFIFGDYWAQKLGLPAVGMPDYGGYAIGYRVVQAYLQRSGATIEEATFTPTAQIIAESGYFD